MEEKIKEIQSYFKNKLLSRDFEIIKIESCTISILIGGKYEFTIWSGNWDIPNTRDLYDNGTNFIKFNLNQKERTKLHGILKKDISDFRKNVLLAEKRKAFEKLKKELESELLNQ